MFVGSKPSNTPAYLHPRPDLPTWAQRRTGPEVSRGPLWHTAHAHLRKPHEKALEEAVSKQESSHSLRAKLGA